MAGKTIKYDIDFIQTWFERNKDSYFYSYIAPGPFELLTLASMYEIYHNKKVFDNYQLQTICNVLEIELTEAHDAMADIMATRSCCFKIWNEITKE